MPLSAAPATPITDERPVLVAPDSFKGTLRAAEVAAAIGRGLERGGLVPPDLMPVADGGEGTMEALLLGARRRDARRDGARAARRARSTAGFGLLADGDARDRRDGAGERPGARARGERDAEAATTHGTGELILAAVDAGAQVVVSSASAAAPRPTAAPGALEAIADGGGLRGARLVALCDVRTTFDGRGGAVRRRRRARTPRRCSACTRRLERLAETLAARPARRADDRRGGRPGRRALGGARRRAEAGRRASSSTRSTPARGCARRAR